MAEMVKRGIERRHTGRAAGTAENIIKDMINFSSDASFAVDHEGKVIAWNDAMEHLTAVSAEAVVGKRDFAHSEPLFGKKRKTLVDLVFATDDDIRKNKYMIVNRVKNGPVIAVTRATKPDNQQWTLWMKAMPVTDSQGHFIGAVGTVKDVTSTFSEVPCDKEAAGTPDSLAFDDEEHVSQETGIFDKLFGKANTGYKKGVHLFAKEMNYKAAIEAFDQVLKLDNKLPHVWNDRGLCYRALNDTSEALKSMLRAVELDPENPEYLYNLGETLEIIGVLYMSNKYLDSAVKTFQMVVNQMPNNADAWNHIGVCMKEMGKSEESKFYFDRSRDIKMWKKHTPIIPKRDKHL
jgi:PAS domain S-box-containing protein